MKKYEKVYEEVYTSKRITSKLDITRASNDLGLTMVEFAQALREAWMEMSISLYESSLKMEWLARQFKYKVKISGRERYRRKRTTGSDAPHQWGVFTKNYAGVDVAPLRISFVNHAIVKYVDELLPQFSKKNPYKDTEYFKYPFEFITVDYMVLVYQMECRMDLLRIAEEEKMSFAEFIDYVINHVGCHNEEIGKDQYVLISANGKAPLYFKNTMKKGSLWRQK